MHCLIAPRFLGLLSVTALTLLGSPAGAQSTTPPPAPPAEVPIPSPPERTPHAEVAAYTATPPVADEVRSTIRPHPAVAITGGTLLVGGYVPAMIIAAQSSRDTDQQLYIPVVGPWMDLANRKCDVHPCTNEDWNKVGLVATGVAQGAGAILLVASLFVPESRVLRFASRTGPVTVLPMATPTTMGMTAFAAF